MNAESVHLNDALADRFLDEWAAQHPDHVPSLHPDIGEHWSDFLVGEGIAPISDNGVWELIEAALERRGL